MNGLLMSYYTIVQSQKLCEFNRNYVFVLPVLYEYENNNDTTMIGNTGPNFSFITQIAQCQFTYDSSKVIMALIRNIDKICMFVLYKNNHFFKLKIRKNEIKTEYL